MICIVGYGSLFFHATLLRTTQLMDELPMIFMAMSCFYLSETGFKIFI